MELNNNVKKTYIQLLIDSLAKKYKVLSELMQITNRQKEIIESESFDEDEFLQTIDLKEKQINDLSELDRGFELVYEHIGEELKENTNKYSAEITHLKDLVTKVTDLTMKLQALEKMNKSKLESLLANKRKEIGKARINNKTVTNYYKNMSGLKASQSYFYDKKN